MYTDGGWFLPGETRIVPGAYPDNCPQGSLPQFDYDIVNGLAEVRLITDTPIAEESPSRLLPEADLPDAVKIPGEKIRLVHAITTFERPDNLRRSVESWAASISRDFDWTLILADDGSEDGTLEYLADLKISGVRILHIRNQRRGVHHQTNCIFRLCENLEYDLAFKADDDILYSPGWDKLYVAACRNVPHLVFHDPTWHQTKSLLFTRPDREGLLEMRSREIHGAFWTFTPEVIRKVGYFDSVGMGPCGIGHQDFTRRCKRAGLNGPYRTEGAWDAAGSPEVLRLIPWVPKGSAAYSSRHARNQKEEIRRKVKLAADSRRVRIPYAQGTVDMNGDRVPHVDISIITPIRGREEMKPGFEVNMRKAFPGKELEIIYVEQDDVSPFLRGQLINLGFRYSRAPVVVLHDVDCRHLGVIDLTPLKEGPFSPWDRLAQIDDERHLLFPETVCRDAELRPSGWGGCNILTREQFILSGGFSNLPLGWGGEDNILAARANLTRVPGVLAHRRHGGEVCSERIRKHGNRPPSAVRNSNLVKTDSERDKNLDGYAQTIADVCRGGNILRCRNIRTSEGFEYRELLKPEHKGKM